MVQTLVFEFWKQFSWGKRSMNTSFRITWDFLSNVDPESLSKPTASASLSGA